MWFSTEAGVFAEYYVLIEKTTPKHLLGGMSTADISEGESSLYDRVEKSEARSTKISFSNKGFHTI